MATVAPSAARCFAIAAPMPRDPPVTSATLPARSLSFLLLISSLSSLRLLFERSVSENLFRTLSFALRLFFAHFILNDIPMLDQNIPFGSLLPSGLAIVVTRSKTESRVQRRAPGTGGARRDWSRGR